MSLSATAIATAPSSHRDDAFQLVNPNEPAPWVGTPLAPAWVAWSNRMTSLIGTGCGELARRERRARQVTVTLYYADGKRLRMATGLAHATDQPTEVIPAALGLLRILVDRRPGIPSRLAVHLGDLVEGAHQPICFARYLEAKRPPLWRRLGGWMFAALTGQASGGRVRGIV